MKLENLNKQTGFKTPDNYFESLEDKILSQAKLQEKVSDSGFAIPDDYFKTIENCVLDAVSEEKDTKVVSLFSRKNIIYISSIAAAVLIMFGIFSRTTTPTFEGLDETLVENYILEQDYETYEIASLLSEEDLSNELININYSEENLEDFIFNNSEVEDFITQ